MNVNYYITKEYEKRTLGQHGKKQSQTNPNKANFKKAKMKVMSYITKDYENISNWAIYENEPNFSRRSLLRSRITAKLFELSSPAGHKENDFLVLFRGDSFF